MQHPEFEAHLRAHPEDWPSWLVYADWLTEGGDPRGELLVLEHRLERPDLSVEERARLRRRVNALDTPDARKRQFGVSDEEYRELVEHRRFRWRHGFVAGLTVHGLAAGALPPQSTRFLQSVGSDAETVIALVDAGHVRSPMALTCAPAHDPVGMTHFHRWLAGGGPRGLRALKLSTHDLTDAELRTLVDSEAVESVVDLSLSQLRSVEALRALSRSTRLGAVRVLEVHTVPDDDPASSLDALLDGPLLRSVATLRLLHPGLGPDELERLASSLTAVRDLDLSSNGLTASSLRPLTRLGSLRGLSLDDNQRIGASGIRALAASGLLSGVGRLGLRATELGDEGVRALAEADLSHLQELDLAGNGIGPEGVAALASAGWLGGLRELDLSWNPLGDSGGRALANAPFGSLTRLELARTAFTSKGTIALASSGILRTVRHLNLRENPIGNEGASALAGSEHLLSLETLHLMDCRFQDPGAIALAGSGALSGLTELDLSYNHWGFAGVQAMARSPLARTLHLLRAWGGKVGGSEGGKLLDEAYGERLQR